MDVQEFRALMQARHETQETIWAGAPSLAASTVAMKNTSGDAVGLRVTGGTVTVIKVNGVTITNVTSGYVHLRPGDKVAITYSVAPTLQWFLE